MYYVYLLRCNDDGWYVGCTSDLKDRISRHQKKQVLATVSRTPIKLIAYFGVANRYVAYNFEKYLKSGSGRAFLKKHFVD